jgi:TrmH family RNA methyltransferase
MLGLGAVLVGVRDPATAGSILSSCAAAGGVVAIATEGTTDLFAPKPVRSAAGAHFVLAIASDIPSDACAAALRAAGAEIVAVGEDGGEAIELGPRVAVVVGEDAGLPPAFSGASVRRVGRSAIRPSVSAQAAVVLFEAAGRGDG